MLFCVALAARADDGEPIAIYDGTPDVGTPAPEALVAGLRTELVAIFIDGVEAEVVEVYRDRERFFLPVTLLSRMHIRVGRQGGALVLETPGGTVATDSGRFTRIAGRSLFRIDLLDDVQVQWRFLQDRYALDFTLPWWQQPDGREDTPAAPGKIDFEPSTFGLTQARLDHIQFHEEDEDSRYGHELLLRGRFADGVWQGEVYDTENRDLLASDYYWLRDFEHVQTLAGNQQVQINPVLPGLETTGLQALYNSEPLEFDPHLDQTRNQYIRHLGIPTRVIEGAAQSGAIAELRIDDRPIARTRVRLDGTYSFRGVQLSSLQFVQIEVHVLDQRSLLVLEVQDFTQTPIDLLLKQGQTLAFGGAGVDGNPLDPNRDVKDEAVYGLWRYGLTDTLTLEAGAQTASGRAYETVGATASLGRRWAVSTSLGNHDDARSYSADLYGRGRQWQMNVRSLSYDEGFYIDASPETARHELRFEKFLNNRLSVGAYGRVESRGDDDDSSLLPGFSWRFGNRSNLRVWGDTEGDYRVDLRTYHGERDRFEFSRDGTSTRAEYRRSATDTLELIASVVDTDDYGDPLVEVGAQYYPRAYDDRSMLWASALASGSELGYRVRWETPVLPGFFSTLELHDEPVRSEFYDPGFQLRWTLSLDYSFAGARPIPAVNEFNNSRYGAIGGRLMLSDGGNASDAGIRQVSVMVDGVPRNAPVNGNYFFVDHVPPGVYAVSLSSEHLPMQLTPDQRLFHVKVGPSATTRVDFEVRQEYGLFGRVSDDRAAAMADLVVRIFDGTDTLVTVTRTDAYGYYRLNGLAPDEYRIEVLRDGRRVAERRVNVSENYLFDVDFTVHDADGAPDG